MTKRMKKIDTYLPPRQKASIDSLASALKLRRSSYVQLALGLAAGGYIQENAIVRAVAANASRGGNTVHLCVSLPTNLCSFAQSEADRFGVSLAAYLRAVLSIPCMPGTGDDAIPVLEVGPLKNEVRALRTELSRIGNNVNQVAHAMNILKNKQWVSTVEARAIIGHYDEVLGAIKEKIATADEHASELTAILNALPCDVMPHPRKA